MEQHADGLWSVAADQAFLGLKVGTRMTVVRFADGSLLVHSPVALRGELKAEVDAIGEVRHIVAPNITHHLYAGEWKAAYPAALLHGARGLAKRRKDLTFDRQLGGAPDPEWIRDLQTVDLDGTMLEETVLIHPESRSLIVADAIENFETSTHWPTLAYLKLCGIHRKPGLSRPLRWTYRDRPKARRSIDRILEHNFDRIILAHGDVVETGGAQVFRHTYDWLEG